MYKYKVEVNYFGCCIEVGIFRGIFIKRVWGCLFFV